MNILKFLSGLTKVGEGLLLVGGLLSDLGAVLSGRPIGSRDSEQDSLTHGVESEKPEDDTKRDFPKEGDTIVSLEEGRSQLRAERHSPEPFD